MPTRVSFILTLFAGPHPVLAGCDRHTDYGSVCVPILAQPYDQERNWHHLTVHTPQRTMHTTPACYAY